MSESDSSSMKELMRTDLALVVENTHAMNVALNHEVNHLLESCFLGNHIRLPDFCSGSVEVPC